MDERFIDIIQIIKQSRVNAMKMVNAELINLYWKVGEYISNKLERAEWGDSVVVELAKYISCIFSRKTDTHSCGKRTRIPAESGQPPLLKADGDSC